MGAQGTGGGRRHFKGRWPRQARFATGLAFAAIAASTPALHAQPLQSPREPVVVSPRLKVDSGVLFPDQARRDHVAQTVNVDVVLLVDADGRVSDAKIVSPIGHGFDEAALAAARKLVFEPATRDGRPIAARIKYRYAFVPPSVTLAGEVRRAGTGGLSSVVPTELVDQIDFYPGNFSARYGRAMGGIVDTSLRPPRTDGYHLVLENSVLGFRGIVEGSLGHGFSFFAAGQRSWPDLLLTPLLTPLLKATGAEQTALPSWADYQLAVQKDFTASSSARVLFFGSRDAFDIVEPIANASDASTAGALGYHTSFWRAQASFDSQLSGRTHLKLTTAYGQDRLAIALGNNLIDATLHPLSSRAELSHQLAPGIRANVGWDALYEPYSFALQLPAATRPGYSLVYSFTDRSNENPTLDGVTYGGAAIDPSAGLELPHCQKSSIDECSAVKLDVRVPSSSQETDPSNLSPSGDALGESLYVQYFSTAGKIANDTILIFDPRDGRLTHTGNDFRAPLTPGEYLLWAVLHDNRGGTAWQQLSLRVR